MKVEEFDQIIATVYYHHNAAKVQCTDLITRAVFSMGAVAILALFPDVYTFKDETTRVKFYACVRAYACGMDPMFD